MGDGPKVCGSSYCPASSEMAGRVCSSGGVWGVCAIAGLGCVVSVGSLDSGVLRPATCGQGWCVLIVVIVVGDRVCPAVCVGGVVVAQRGVCLWS